MEAGEDQELWCPLLTLRFARRELLKSGRDSWRSPRALRRAEQRYGDEPQGALKAELQDRLSDQDLLLIERSACAYR